MEQQYLTTGQLAIRLGVLPHHLQRLANAGKIPSTRANRFHLFAASDVPTIRSALIAAGFLSEGKEAAHVG